MRKIKQAVSRLFSICKYCGKGNCEKAAVGSRGGDQVWLRYLVPGGPLSRGDCPRRDRKRRKKDDEIRLFRRSVSQLPHTQRYVREYICELLSSIILSACLVWGL